MKIGVLVGSLRKESYSRLVADTLIDRNKTSLDYEIVETGHLPLYNQDIDHNNSIYEEFRQHIKSFDGFVFVTPEYNRSIPANLKNALDVGSRPAKLSSFSGKKPAGILSVTPGRLGAFGANHHLRQVLSFLDLATMSQPETYMSNIAEDINEGKVVGKYALRSIDNFLESFEDWCAKVK